ncbi:MAG: ABC transporter substrate-binding protein [Firmicutes bacterium]|nr:ABC transporter substrate-binding protein [Bacillota bacterium]
MKRYAIALASVTTLSLALAGCGTFSSATLSSNSGASIPFTTINEAHGITVGAPYNPFNTNGNTWDGYDQWQLAFYTNSLTNPNSFIPGLAKSWTVNANQTKVVVTLQPNARWSNGQPVTANDVVTSMAIAFTQGNAQAFDLGTVKALNNHQVEFEQLPGDHYNLFLNQLLQQTIVPSSEFAPVLPKNIWTIIDTAQYTGNNSKLLAKAKKAANELATIGKKVAAYAPPKSEDLSAGPFVLKNLNTGEAILVKNPYFYDAKNVHVKEVVMRNYTGNEQIWNYLESGQLDFAPYTSMPTNILDQVLRTKGNKEVVTPAVVAASLAFNENIYPYNMVKVRQALAYVINRQVVQKIAEPVSGTPAKWPDGLIDAATKQWMTPAQLASLNTYSPNLSKATKLLKESGFKLVNGQWMMPNGKPWTMTIYTVNGFSDWIAAAKVISSELTSFGIPTSPDIVSSYAQELKEQQDGKLPVSFYLMGLGPTPANAFNMIYGVADGYNLIGTHLVRYPASAKDKGNWIDLPATIPTTTGKMINPGVLTNELSEINSVAKQRPIVQELAEATDRNVPVITLWDYINVQFVNTTRFTDFPTSAAYLDNPAGVWMQAGYVRPKS